MIKKILLILSLVAEGAPSTSFAYRPLGTEDAGVAGKGLGQLELSWDYLKWGGDKENIFLAVPIYGLTERLELSAEIPFLAEKPASEASSEGIGDINLVGKYLLIEENEGHPAFTLKGVLKLDNGDFAQGQGSGDKDYSLFAVSSRTIGNVSVHGHLGYTWVGRDKDENLRNIYLYGLAVDFGVSEALHVVGEIDGNRHPERTGYEAPRVALLGITYKFSEKLTGDIGVRKGLTETAPDWSTTTGVSITF